MMVNQILSDPREGPSTYFEMVNFMFLQAGVAQAHRNRVDILEQRLLEQAAKTRDQGRRMRILNVGCGPAGELQRIAASNAELDHLDIVLMDFSDETLLYASQSIGAAADAAGRERLALSLRHESVHQLLKRSARAQGIDLAGAVRFHLLRRAVRLPGRQGLCAPDRLFRAPPAARRHACW